jgi:natural product biosynthesis luciferase-like monooxygenase protein
MDFSLFYFANDSRNEGGDRYRLLLDGARFADRNGFAAVWTPERHFHPFGGLYPNPSVTSAAVAAVTKRVKIRAGSVVAPLHHPLRIAEEWSVVDNLSNGRAGISFASGWNTVDFAFNPGVHAERRSLLDERIEQVRRLWRGETIPVTDGSGETQQVRIYPPPVQPELPVWITSGGSIKTFQKAGQIGAGVLTYLLTQDLDQLAVKIAAYRAALSARDVADSEAAGHVVLMVHTFLGENEDEVRELVRPPMYQYIRSSLDHRLSSADSIRTSAPKRLRDADIEFLVTRTFDRYLGEGALIGTVEKARGMIERFRVIGIDEIACLIDFGLPAATVLSGLKYLNDLRQELPAANRL